METLTFIYVHIDPTKLNFSKELFQSSYTFSNLPSYANTSIEQTKKITKEDPIIITNEYVNEHFQEQIKEFYELCKKGMPTFYKDTFWLTTLIRLYVIYLYCSKNGINKFIHLEYDNLIYSDFKNLENLPQNVYFTKVGELYSSAGFVYCNNLQSYENFIKKLKQLLLKGETVIKNFTSETFLSEMVLINLIGKHTNTIDYLPSLPFEPANNNFDDLNTLYDGASYGQYLGGTNNGNEPGWTGNHHFVGREIQTQNIKVYFDKTDKTPYIRYKDKVIPIANLHVHSKKLEQFI